MTAADHFAHSSAPSQQILTGTLVSDGVVVEDGLLAIDGVEQLTRYLELLNRDPLLAPVRGIFAAQQIKPQAKVLANDRGIDCITLDYDAMRGVDDSESRLF